MMQLFHQIMATLKHSPMRKSLVIVRQGFAI
jgi:hypothetical protein